MRKYQQLLLLVISCISVIVLFVYKSENNRLKYVLHVVNFFGRKDVAFFGQFENFTRDNVDFAHPLPVWQALDPSFYSYAAYYVPAADNYGMVVAEVVGKRDAHPRFECAVIYEDNVQVAGKFRFQSLKHKTDEFSVYNFFCDLDSKTKKTKYQPESIVFLTDKTNFKNGVSLHLRTLDTSNTGNLQPATICLDLVTDANNVRPFSKNNKYMVQFFLHHKALGIEHFIVYNGDALSSSLVKLLRQAQVQLHLIPFNFPFHLNRDSDASVRQMLQVNCIRRSKQATNYTITLAPNEFLYANHKLSLNRPILSTSREAVPYQITRVNICLNTPQTLLMDNYAYDASQDVAEHSTLYALQKMSILNTANILDSVADGEQVPTDVAFIHKYVDCVHIGADGLSDWRTKLKEDFKQFLKIERSELSLFIK